MKRMSTKKKRKLLNGKEKICVYCGISEEECKDFFEKNQHFTRGGHRGYSLEVDRIDSSLDYTEENVVWACYVCNNSKSNYCNSAKEFEPIAKAIRETWIKRGYNPK
jgi:hypothetical protein